MWQSMAIHSSHFHITCCAWWAGKTTGVVLLSSLYLLHGSRRIPSVNVFFFDVFWGRTWQDILYLFISFVQLIIASVKSIKSLGSMCTNNTTITSVGKNLSNSETWLPAPLPFSGQELTRSSVHQVCEMDEFINIHLWWWKKWPKCTGGVQHWVGCHLRLKERSSAMHSVHASRQPCLKTPMTSSASSIFRPGVDSIFCPPSMWDGWVYQHSPLVMKEVAHSCKTMSVPYCMAHNCIALWLCRREPWKEKSHLVPSLEVKLRAIVCTSWS